MKSPLVSIIVLNWNGKKWLEKCLPSLEKISYKNVEIIVVNNGSSDDSAEFLRKNYPKIEVVEIKENVGYARGNNVGVAHAKGKYILSLNNDTTVLPSFLEPLVEVLEKDKTIGIVQPQIRSMKEKGLLDSVGSYLTFNGFLYHYGYMKNYTAKLYSEKMFAYSIKGTCFLISLKDYKKLGGFDEDFVYYVEETDLCHRMWLYGKKVIYEPRSAMYHWGGGDMHLMTSNQTIIYRSYRNRIISYLKNFDLPSLMKIMPIHLIFCYVFIFISLLKGDLKRAWGAQSALLSVLTDLPSILRKRKIIQTKFRRRSDKELLPFIVKNPKLSYYYYMFYDIKRFIDD